MVKTFGSVDKVSKRKTRLDKGKRRKFYAKKPVKKKRKKHGRFVPYESLRKKGDPIKLRIYQELPMSKEGYMKWNKKLRKKIRKIVYKSIMRVDVLPINISTKEKVESFCENILWDGVFIIKGYSHGTNKFRVKEVPLAKVKIRDTPNGLVANMIFNYRLYRYKWFYKT